MRAWVGPSSALRHTGASATGVAEYIFGLSPSKRQAVSVKWRCNHRRKISPYVFVVVTKNISSPFTLSVQGYMSSLIMYARTRLPIIAY